MIDFEQDHAIGHLTLNRPEKLNALNEDAWRELSAILEQAGRDRTVKVLVISGAGRCFSAGADIGTFSKLTDDREVYEFITAINAAMRALEEFSKPVISAVHGFAYGGGCELTMMSDIVVADETARFALPEIKSGIMPGPGLVRGTSHASLHVLKYLALTGESLSAEEAQRSGLVNRLEEAQKQYQLDRFLGQLDRAQLLICDELGYLSFSRAGAELLFQVFADRYERKSLLITSNLAFSDWGQVFQGERMTAALLDRLTHRCHIFEMNGESYRFRESMRTRKSKGAKDKVAEKETAKSEGE